MTMSVVIRNAVDHLTTGWRAPAVLAAGGVGALGSALFMQHVVGLQPCIMCIYQRWPYAIMVLLGLATLAFGRNRRVRVGLLGLIVVAMVVDCGLAVTHVGIENHWWAGSAGCGVPPPAASFEELRARMMEAPVVRCDIVVWTLFGISMAGYNIIITLVLAVFAALAAIRAAQPNGRRCDGF